MPVSKEDIMRALSAVRDESGGDLVSLGRIESIDIDGADVTVHAGIPSIDPAERAAMEAAIESAVKKAVHGVKRVKADIGFSAPARQQHAHEPAPKENLLPDVRHVLLVGSGKGGVGKSTVAVNMAVTLLKRGLKVGLLDMDVYGPSIPTMLGLFARPETDGEKIIPLDAGGMPVMSLGFLIEPGEAVIWRGPMLNTAARQFLGEVDWGPLDVLVVDLPPGTGDVAISMAQLTKVSGAVVVSTPQEVSLVDVRRAVGMFRRLEIPVLGIVENMSHFVCDGCGKVHEIFARGGAKRAAEEMEIPFLGEIPLTPAVREGGDAGRPAAAVPGSPAAAAFESIARQVMTALDARTVKS
jgi:ATP-binding protein involved in chromosome partitioning